MTTEAFVAIYLATGAIGWAFVVGRAARNNPNVLGYLDAAILASVFVVPLWPVALGYLLGYLRARR